jgi:hypothetical protein
MGGAECPLLASQPLLCNHSSPRFGRFIDSWQAGRVRPRDPLPEMIDPHSHEPTSAANGEPGAPAVRSLKALADRFPRLRRGSLLILAAGGVAAWLFISPHMPRDHEISLRFEADAAEIIELETAWTPVATEAREPISGARYPFEAGRAPRVVHATVRAPNGEYWVDLVVQTAQHTVRARRAVALGSDAARVDVPVPPPSSSFPTR